jgi:hypothetical protein
VPWGEHGSVGVATSGAVWSGTAHSAARVRSSRSTLSAPLASTHAQNSNACVRPQLHPSRSDAPAFRCGCPALAHWASPLAPEPRAGTAVAAASTAPPLVAGVAEIAAMTAAAAAAAVAAAETDAETHVAAVAAVAAAAAAAAAAAPGCRFHLNDWRGIRRPSPPAAAGVAAAPKRCPGCRLSPSFWSPALGDQRVLIQSAHQSHQRH